MLLNKHVPKCWGFLASARFYAQDNKDCRSGSDYRKNLSLTTVWVNNTPDSEFLISSGLRNCFFGFKEHRFTYPRVT